MTTLVLGGVTFQHAEIPSHINFGGHQMMAVKQLIGGERYVQSLGASEAPLAWSGIFLGSNAEFRARYLNQMRQEGKQLTLSWSSERYLVVIRSFVATFMQTYRVPYRISCEAVEDQTSRVDKLPANSADQQIRADMATATTQASGITDNLTVTSTSPSLSTSLDSLNTAIEAVSDFATASQDVLNTVLNPLADAMTRTDLLISSAARTAENVSTLGGILPDNTVANGISNVITQVSEESQLPQLYNLKGTLGRINGNIGNLNGSTRTEWVQGADLQQLAAKYYNDVTKWTVIADANGLIDPIVTGAKKLIIP